MLSTVNSVFSMLENYKWKHFNCGKLLCHSLSIYFDVKVIVNDSLPSCVYNLYSALPLFKFRNFLIFHILKEESQGRFKKQVIL